MKNINTISMCNTNVQIDPKTVNATVEVDVTGCPIIDSDSTYQEGKYYI